MAILPQLDEHALYQQFKLDEPWDSAHNKPLLDRMPRIFAPVDVKDAPANSTYYRVFVTDPRTNNGPPSAFMVGVHKGRSVAAMGDGTAGTIAVVEAGDPVPWTKPQELEFTVSKPLPPLGGMSSGGWMFVGMADGSCLMIRKDISPDRLRAAITADGAETTWLE